jgi:hypothetical protein
MGDSCFRPKSPGSVEAEYLVYLIRRLEKACCLQALTYALMANHFDIFCKAPERQPLSDQELLDCIELGYGPERRTQVAEQLAAYAKGLNGDRSTVGRPKLSLCSSTTIDLSPVRFPLEKLKKRDPTKGSWVLETTRCLPGASGLTECSILIAYGMGERVALYQLLYQCVH